METFFHFLKFIDNHLLKGIFISVLILILFRKYFKKIDTVTSFKILKYLLVSYSILSLTFILTSFFVKDYTNPMLLFINRLTNPYKTIVGLMLILHVCLPLFLLSKWLSKKTSFILTISFLINLEWLFNSYVVHIITMHREYVTGKPFSSNFLPFQHELIILLEGFLLGLVLLFLGNFSRLHRSIKE